jgi:hypothetical protein
VLAHELRPEQHRAERPVVDHDPDRLTSLVEADHHHGADRLTPHDRCVVLDESVVSVAADVVELLVVVQLPGKAKDRAYRLRPSTIPVSTDRSIVTSSARLSSHSGR